MGKDEQIDPQVEALNEFSSNEFSSTLKDGEMEDGTTKAQAKTNEGFEQETPRRRAERIVDSWGDSDMPYNFLFPVCSAELGPHRALALQGSHSHSLATEYPPRTLQYAVEHVGIFPTGDENVDKENLKCIISKSNDGELPSTPRPLPIIPIVLAKGNDDGFEKIQAGYAFDDLLGNMVDLVQAEGVALKPGRDGAAANSASAQSEAVLRSLSYLLPRPAEKRDIGSEKTDLRKYNCFDEAMGSKDKAAAAARMDRFLAGGDELTAINDQPCLDEAEAPKPKKKKKKNKMSSKKRKRLRARKTSLEGLSAAAENEQEHDVSQNTTNETAKPTFSACVSNSAYHEHDISHNATDEKGNKAASESASTAAQHSRAPARRAPTHSR